MEISRLSYFCSEIGSNEKVVLKIVWIPYRKYWKKHKSNADCVFQINHGLLEVFCDLELHSVSQLRQKEARSHKKRCYFAHPLTKSRYKQFRNPSSTWFLLTERDLDVSVVAESPMFIQKWKVHESIGRFDWADLSKSFLSSQKPQSDATPRR